jgi:hypothetical protein
MWSWWRRRGRLSSRRERKSRTRCHVSVLTSESGKEEITTRKETPGRILFPLIPSSFYHSPYRISSSSSPLLSPAPPRSGMSSSDGQSTQAKFSHQPSEHESWSFDQCKCHLEQLRSGSMYRHSSWYLTREQKLGRQCLDVASRETDQKHLRRLAMNGCSYHRNRRTAGGCTANESTKLIRTVSED